MSGFLRKSFIFLLSAVYLVGCGGSGVNDSGTTPNPDGTGTTPTALVTVKFVDAANAPVTQVTTDAPARVIANVTVNGTAVAGKNVTFALEPQTIGALSQTTKITDASGNAEVQLLAGTVTGGTKVTASITEPVAASGSNAIDVVVASAVAKLELASSAVALPSGSTEAINLTAVVKNANNVGVAGVKVVFAADSGQLSVAGSGADGSVVTDANGQAKATLSQGSDKSNRVITVKATTPLSADLKAEAQINVTDTKLSISPLEKVGTTIAKGATLPLSIVLADSNKQGIPNQSLVVTSGNGNTLSNAAPKTALNGSAEVVLTAVNAGTDTITVKAFNGTLVMTGTLNVTAEDVVFKIEQTNPGNIALNAPANFNLTWSNAGAAQAGTIGISSTRGVIGLINGASCDITTPLNTLSVAAGAASFCVQSTNAGPAIVTAVPPAGPSASASVNFIATTPHTLVLTASPRTIGPDGDTSTVRALVRDANGNLVTGADVQFTLTDVSGGSISRGNAATVDGVAQITYTSKSTSAADGVTILAKVGAIEDLVTLTVARRSLFITFGTGNQLASDITSYTKEYLVFVTDANSAPVRDQELILAASPPVFSTTGNTAYAKGFYEWDGKKWAQKTATSCENEDKDSDGELDAGEDFNNNGKLTPGNVVAITDANGVPGRVVTGADGTAIFKIRYPKQFANWTAVDLKVTAPVGGSESTASSVIWLPALAGDFTVETTTPPGQPSPFGVAGSCADKN